MNGQIDRSGARVQRQRDFARVQTRLVPSIVLTTDDGMAQLDVPRPYRTHIDDIDLVRRNCRARSKCHSPPVTLHRWVVPVRDALSSDPEAPDGTNR